MIEIGGLQKTTLIDYPGRVACTVFLIGCNFRCPFCYSPELVLPERIKLQPRISEKDFFKFLKERKNLIEGVVICGGEPTINKDLPQLCKKIKKLGYFVKLDTNGSNPEMLKKLIEGGGSRKSMTKRDTLSSLTSLPRSGSSLIDYVAMDIKAPKEKYNKIAGVKVDIRKIQESIDILKEGKIDYEFRSTILPKFHTKRDIINMAKWIKGAKKYCLQNFRPEKTIDPKFEKIKPYSKEFLSEMKKEISPFFEACEVRG